MNVSGLIIAFHVVHYCHMKLKLLDPFSFCGWGLGSGDETGGHAHNY